MTFADYLFVLGLPGRAARGGVEEWEECPFPTRRSSGSVFSPGANAFALERVLPGVFHSDYSSLPSLSQTGSLSPPSWWGPVRVPKGKAHRSVGAPSTSTASPEFLTLLPGHTGCSTSLWL